jgi:hypothetical protein
MLSEIICILEGFSIAFFIALCIGLVWHKNRLDAIIEYNDGIQKQKDIFDFDANVEYAQTINM